MNNKNLQKNNINASHRVYIKRWVDLFKKSASYPQVRPDPAKENFMKNSRQISSKMWVEANRKEIRESEKKQNIQNISSEMWLEAARKADEKAVKKGYPSY